uniref:Uncharacterized protein n=1 Tax=Rhizophora mucronata TaxID=61149 RepID=A0A2P2NW90_RHIMU
MVQGVKQYDLSYLENLWSGRTPFKFGLRLCCHCYNMNSLRFPS